MSQEKDSHKENTSEKLTLLELFESKVRSVVESSESLQETEVMRGSVEVPASCLSGRGGQAPFSTALAQGSVWAEELMRATRPILSFVAA